ncbi:response regulator [Paenibacillus senegalimassiliensis]|uniref:response regulator n=1 Tax=Paenibacillus senegalimassiliensis TaxID=1737426 RepID=UPI00073E6774|nr:response regulator [Paenibacillus senegalimassiliensis]
MAFKVLLIDDEPWALEGLQLWIDWEGLGFDVCGTCGNGAQGLKLMEELEPDLVMVDIHMPVMDGLEMIQAWRKAGRQDTKFVILTGYSDFEYARKALKCRVSRYLLKPLDEEQTYLEIQAIQQELREEQAKLQISKAARREKETLLIQELLTGSVLSQPDREELESLSLLATYWNVCLVQGREKELMRLRSMVAESASEREGTPMYLAQLRPHVFCLVFGSYEHQEGQSEDRIEAIARHLAGFHACVSIGVGKRVASLMEIGASYRAAADALMHTFYESGRNKIIHYADVKEGEFQSYYQQADLLERVLDSLRVLDAADYEEIVNSIDQAFREASIYPDEARKFIIYLLHEISMYMSGQMEQAAGPSHRLFDIPNLNEGLNFDELIGMLRSCGRACFDWLLQETVAGAQGIVQDINEYMESHFRERLTIKMLAERFFLHPAYLGQLLMRKNGVNFHEFLHNLRIEEASRLLRSHRYKNSEIAEMVGYTSYQYFLQQFEKRLGMSPNEYKKT